MEIKELDIRPDGRRKGEKQKWSPKIYVFVDNESIMDNLINRHSRPYEEYKKHVLPQVMKEIEKRDPKLFAQIKDAKWSWDKHCGCSMCPCSPGFIAKGIFKPVDIYVTI